MEASPKELRVDSNGWHLVNQGTRIFFRVKPQKEIKNGMKQSVAWKRELLPADTKVYRPKVLWCKRRNVATEREKWGTYFLPSSIIRRCMTKEESGYQVLIYIYRFLHGKCWRTIFTHEFVFTKRTSEALRASDGSLKTNECVNIVQKHFPWWSLFIIYKLRFSWNWRWFI